VYVPWEQFFATVRVNRDLAAVIYTCAVTNFKAGSVPVSMSLFHDDLKFIHPIPAPFNTHHPWHSIFHWDAKADRGYSFRPTLQDTMWPDTFSVSKFANPNSVPKAASPSSRIALNLVLANASRIPKDVEVTAKLGGHTLGQPVRRQLPPYTGNVPVEIAPVLGAPLPRTLAPGHQTLLIEARSGGRLVDSISVAVEVGPSQVLNVHFDPRDDNHFLAWDKVPQAGVEYVVRFVESTLGNVTSEVVVPEPEFKFGTGYFKPKKPSWFYVTARDVATKIEGPPSDYLDCEDPWIGQWSGSVTLVKGSLAPAVKTLFEQMSIEMNKKQDKQEAELNETLRSARDPERQASIRDNIRDFKDKREKIAQGFAGIQSTVEGVVISAEALMRLGLPTIQFEITRRDKKYYMKILKIGFWTATFDEFRLDRLGPIDLGRRFENDEWPADSPLRKVPPWSLHLNHWDDILTLYDLKIDDEKLHLDIQARVSFSRQRKSK
jgi:hypothetical protein